MDWVALFVVFLNIIVLQARHDLELNKLIEIIKRRNNWGFRPATGGGPILGVPKYPEHLPEAEPILPGHTLIRPSQGMLKSAVKFPHRDLGGSLVYGNIDNLGLSYGKNDRVLYSDFRKANNLLTALEHAITEAEKRNSRPLLVIEINPKKLNPKRKIELLDSEENDAREILDELVPDTKYFDENNDQVDFRRKRSGSKYRQRSYELSASSDSDTSDEYERNSGNPYTIFKNKYKQNWMWNHAMDGDHMNINPLGPTYQNTGPSGVDLFLGRKWWYFNQDDYKPMK